MDQQKTSHSGPRWLLLAFICLVLSIAATAQITCTNPAGCAGTCPSNSCRVVTVGGNGSTIPYFFQDGITGTTISTIFANSYIHWNFVGMVGHTSTSGTCVGNTCTGDGKWATNIKMNNQFFEVLFNNAASFPYFCLPHQGAHKATINVTDFALGLPTSATVTAVPGTTSSSTTFAVSMPGSFFAKTVTLSCPNGVACNFSPSSTLNFNNSSSQNVTVTINVPANAVATTTAITVSANSSMIVSGVTVNAPAAKTQSINLAVSDYSLTLNNSLAAALPGGSGNFQGKPNALNGYNSSVNVSCTGVPAQIASCNVAPSSVSPGQSFTVTASSQPNAAPGSYPFTVQSTSGTLTHSQPATLQVANFSVNPTPVPSTTMIAGSISSPIPVSIVPNGAFSALMNFGCSSAPAGVTCSFQPASVFVNGATETALLTLNVPSTVAAVANKAMTVDSSTQVGATTLTVNTPLSLTVTAATTPTNLAMNALTGSPANIGAIGGAVSWSASVGNSGVAATNVDVNFAFSDPIANLSAPACNVINVMNVKCHLNSLGNGGSSSFAFSGQLGMVRNIGVTATISSTTVSDSNLSNNTKSLSLPVRFKPFARLGLVPLP